MPTFGATLSTANWPHRVVGQANPPKKTDDSGDDFGVGSSWIMTDGRSFVCLDPTAGAAVWVERGPGQISTYYSSMFQTFSTSPVLITGMTLTPGAAGLYLAEMSLWGGHRRLNESMTIDLARNATTVIRSWQDMAWTPTDWGGYALRSEITLTADSDTIDWMAKTSNVAYDSIIFGRRCWARRIG